MPVYRFKTLLNTYEATVNSDESFIKIAGEKYKDCINIALIKKDGIPVYAKIPHLESEPECGIAKFLDKDEKDATTDFIRGSLQLVHHLYPSVTQFEFMDDSKIECGVKKPGLPPRNMVTPLSLAYLYIAKYGKSWYEDKFNAKHINPSVYEKFRDSTKILFQPKNMRYEEFEIQNSLNKEQKEFLKPLYEKSISWNDFFKSVPKNDQCKMFVNWLPFFLAKLLNYTFINNIWIINIDTMPKTDLKDITSVMRGGFRRNTRKNKRNSFIFTNNSTRGSFGEIEAYKDNE